jgi:F-type H+-transporting ATPase subunit b
VLNFSVTLLITVFNLTLLYLVLRKFLWKPVTKFMENRTNKIQNDLDAAKRARTHAEEILADYEGRMKGIQAEGQRIMQASRQRAEAEYETMIARAKTESEAIIDAGRKIIEEERRAAERELRERAADLSIMAASRILETNVDNSSNRALVEKFIASVGAA